MIRSRKTTKNCNICGAEVAIKKILAFETVREYVTLRGDLWSMLHNTHRDDVHICNRCLERMAYNVVEQLRRTDNA